MDSAPSLYLLLLLVGFCCYHSSEAKRTFKGELGLLPNGFRVDLIHPAAPSRSPVNSSLSERVTELVRKSHKRAAWIAGKSSSLKLAAYAPNDYESPLTPDGGGYLMEVSMGSPAQKFSCIADTGSDLVWVQSDPCSGCSGAVFHPTASSTYKRITCRSSLCEQLPETSCGTGGSCSYLYQYGSGSTIGIFADDTLSLGTTTGGTAKFSSFALGCGIDNQGFDGFEGLVGLGQGPISLTSQLGSAIDHKFSYCLVDINSASSSSPLYFGSSAALKGSGIQSTPIVHSDEYSTYYLVTVNGMTVAGRAMGEPGTTIFDSGTTLTYVPAAMYSRIKSAFTPLISLPKADGSQYGLDFCYDTSRNKNYKFPQLTIHLAGATMTPPAKNYFLVVDESGDTTCLAMGSADGLPVSIIGNVMQQGYHILYDRSSSTLSFVEEDCASLS